jgi:hypothetical protein
VSRSHDRRHEGLLKQRGKRFDVVEVDLDRLAFPATIREPEFDILTVLVNVR